MPRQYIFDFEIADAHTLASIIRILRTDPSTCALILRKNEVVIPCRYEANGILFELKLFPLQFIRYYLDENLVSSPDEGEHVIFFNPAVLHGQIKGGNKQCRVRLWQFHGQDKMNIYYGMDSGSLGQIGLETIDYVPFDTSGFRNELDETNCRIILREFIAQIKSFKSIQITKATLTVTDRSAHISAAGNSGTSKKLANWPRDEEFEGHEEEFEFWKEIKIGKSVMTMLSHLGSVGGAAVMRVYAEPGSNVVRFMVPVSSFGEFRIYLFPERKE
jgi:hypothetical protein